MIHKKIHFLGGFLNQIRECMEIFCVGYKNKYSEISSHRKCDRSASDRE